MALIKCSECQQTISDKAETCPHCGAPQYATASSMAPPPLPPPLLLQTTSAENARRNVQIGCGIVVLIAVALVAWMINEGGKIGEREKESEKLNPTCISDYTKCIDNAELVAKHKSKGQYPYPLPVICAVEAESMKEKYGTPQLPTLSFRTLGVHLSTMGMRS